MLLTGSAEANSTVTISDGATVLGTAAADGTGAWSYTTAALLDGAHSLTAKATDTAGNVSAASSALSCHHRHCGASGAGDQYDDH